MLKIHNPPTIAPPLLPTYSNGIEAPANARWLYTAGLVGVDKAGNAIAGFENQAEAIWQGLVAVLESADMTVNDIVKMNAFVVHGQDMRSYGAVRKKYLGEHKPASTMITVPALLSPDYLLEVEVIAAKA
ncbi:RidA family protein [Variovorax sp. M-6]|uniref:RidA family protein n=1 Tax=Variovorax sp. M-6 TaxID=3233041 RepID=UPI003F9C8DAB